MIQILGLDHIVLRTVKLKEMLTFYCDVLGCTVEKVNQEISLTQLRAGDSLIDLVEVVDNPDTENPNLDHFCLRVADFNYVKLEKFFKEKNIDIYRYGERYGAQGQGYSFYLKDPQGNELELKAAKSDMN